MVSLVSVKLKYKQFNGTLFDKYFIKLFKIFKL